MSKLLKDNKHFIKLILSTSSLQAKALLKSASKAQLDLFRELALNLHLIPVQRNTLSVPKSSWKIFEQLAKSTRSQRSTQAKLLRNWKRILDVLLVIEDFIDMLLL